MIAHAIFVSESCMLNSNLTNLGLCGQQRDLILDCQVLNYCEVVKINKFLLKTLLQSTAFPVVVSALRFLSPTTLLCSASLALYLQRSIIQLYTSRRMPHHESKTLTNINSFNFSTATATLYYFSIQLSIAQLKNNANTHHQFCHKFIQFFSCQTK